MGFWDDLAKDLSLWAAVEASKDKNGKPDPYKAAGMAAGMGNFSFSDQMTLGAMLGSQGAFNDAPMPETGSGFDYSDDLPYSSSVDNEYEWRDTCEDGSDYDIFPENYETEDEYLEALEEAQNTFDNTAEQTSSSIAEGITIPISLNFTVECPALDRLDAIKESDYPNKRLYEAACKKVKLETGLIICTDKDNKNNELAQCNFVLDNYKTIPAANYLSVEFGEFLYAQAVKENFNLPKSVDIPDEDVEMKTSFEEVFRRVYEFDKTLAFKIWKWCLQTFTPYKEYSSYGETFITREIIENAYMFEDGFIKEVAECIIKDVEFGKLLMENSPQVDSDYSGIFYAILQNNQVYLAKELFSICINKKMDDDYYISFISGIIAECSNYDELETMELFKDALLPMVKNSSNKRVQKNISSWENEILEYIEYLEDNNEKYKLIRKNAWRKGRLDEGLKYDFNVFDYTSEAEYLEDLEEKKYYWRKEYDKQDTYGVNPKDYEDEVSFVKAMEKICDENDIKYENEYQDTLKFLTNPNRRKPPLPKKKNNPTTDAEEIQKLLDDKSIYTYCAVMFPSALHPYHYKTDDETIQIGDKVIVPVGTNNEERMGTVVSIEKHLRVSVPYPVEKTKSIIRKCEDKEIEGENK